MSADAVAEPVKRMRSRYRKLLELKIAETVDGPVSHPGVCHTKRKSIIGPLQASWLLL